MTDSTIYNKKKEKKIVSVISEDGTPIDKTSTRRARDLVKRGCATWSGYNKITLVFGKNKRRELKAKLFETDNTCYICGKELSLYEATIDHVIPQSQLNGRLLEENHKLCCSRCNSAKADTMLEDFLIKVKSDRLKYFFISGNRLQYLIEEYINKEV